MVGVQIPGHIFCTSCHNNILVSSVFNVEKISMSCTSSNPSPIHHLLLLTLKSTIVPLLSPSTCCCPKYSNKTSVMLQLPPVTIVTIVFVQIFSFKCFLVCSFNLITPPGRHISTKYSLDGLDRPHLLILLKIIKENGANNVFCMGSHSSLLKNTHMLHFFDRILFPCYVDEEM